MRPGQPERRTPDYLRHGTTFLFAALDIATGQVMGKCFRRHHSTEFRRFLDHIGQRIPADLSAGVFMGAWESENPAQLLE